MGFEFVKAERNDKRTLIIRDGQHEYVFAETNVARTSTDPLAQSDPFPTDLLGECGAGRELFYETISSLCIFGTSDKWAE
jgi:hypothetical protein